MNWFHALLFGLVEGITEFLPISSTGHLMLTAQVLGLGQSEFIKSFEITIQLGAILAVVCLYWRSLFLNFEALKRVMAAFIPTAILGFAFYKIIKTFLMAGDRVVLGSLFLGGLFLIFFEWLHKEKKEALEDFSKLSYGKAALIGVFQSLAMIPGVSRAAATIVGGLSLGMKRKTVVEFSFLLAVPTMLAAAGFDLLKNGASFNPNQWVFLSVGFLASFVVAILAVKLFVRFVQRRSLMLFGVYRVIVALLFWFIL
ncbi:MAG: undecaprenyl-diphosphatase UppP [Candidatus Omnitrophica bacterium CG07_land_8_20_14_0_80_50_8]|nr:MAG: undecaprenyl-diphosphatase UppP [Candidatus Omnitrophica bacterium CG07_land_8_20_14_0_80_50_8]